MKNKRTFGISKADIAHRLMLLADTMDDVAEDMAYHGGFAAWALHAGEMHGAAAMSRDWAAEIIKEVD